MAIATDAAAPTRSRFAPVAPLAAAGCGAALVAFTAANDPSERAVLPPCPLHAVTGWWCPGCGLTRAAHHLLHGDVAASLSANVLLPVVVVLAALLWWSWWRTSRGLGPSAWLSRVPAIAWVLLLGVSVAYGIARNLPGLHALAP